MTLQLVPDTDERFRAYGARDLPAIGERFGLDPDRVRLMSLISRVLPFRVNEYVLTHLVDWDAVPDDPIFQMVFPQPGMLTDEHLRDLEHERPASAGQIVTIGSRRDPEGAVGRIRRSLNPHPSGQMELNVPEGPDGRLEGLQHKYQRTVLYFPANGQTCHSYCTYCFRWAQFTGDSSMRFAARSPEPAVAYLHDHPEVTDLLVTGGDPMVMSEKRLRFHLEPFLAVDSLDTIRIGTKSLSFWPQRFLSDPDADATLALFEQVAATGRSMALMVQFSHPRELEGDLVRAAVERLTASGVRLYAQAPLMRRVNDDAATWEAMWRMEHDLGIVPYYMFVARETGPHDYYKVPLTRAWEIFTEAYRRLPGLARTVRGPVMSATAGKVVVDGVLDLDEGTHLQLRFLQARDPDLANRPFLARCPGGAAWATDLEPARGAPDDLTAALLQES